MIFAAGEFGVNNLPTAAKVKEKNPRKEVVTMEALEYLRQISKLDAMIEAKQAEVKRLWDIATNITPVMQGAVVSHSAGAGKVESVACKIADVNQEINTAIDNLVDTRREINQLIEQLPSEKQYKVLYKRYFEMKTWEQIACEIGCSYQSVYRLHRRALHNVGNLLKNKAQGGDRMLG